jgi:substrate import-associated zinc metallohydrolase lipoprotein
VNNDPKYPPTELDTWLYNSFTAPYNIEVKYRWDNSEVDPYKNLVPPSIGKVQEVMEVVKRVWIDTYSDIAGDGFIKEYCPKQFVLVGSGSYNFDGSTTLGTAEGGRKVLLYVINHFDATDQEGVKELIHTVEHEFGHILHQNISYPAEFKQITGGSYTANWSSIQVAEARARGFITPYAMASPDEDFVEMIAMMLVEGKDGYERIIACETNGTSRQLLRTKEQTVVEYFRKSYDIDFYELQTKVQEAIQEIAPGEPDPERPPVFDLWGFGKEYSTVRFDLNFMNFPPGFAARFVSDYNALTEHGYALATYFRLFFSEENYVTLQLHYHTIGEGERIYYVANYKYYVVPLEGGGVAFSLEEIDDNGRLLTEEFEARGLVSYFGDVGYEVDWERSSCPDSNLVGFYPLGVPNDGYTFGQLVK